MLRAALIAAVVLVACAMGGCGLAVSAAVSGASVVIRNLPPVSSLSSPDAHQPPTWCEVERSAGRRVAACDLPKEKTP